MDQKTLKVPTRHPSICPPLSVPQFAKQRGFIIATDKGARTFSVTHPDKTVETFVDDALMTAQTHFESLLAASSRSSITTLSARGITVHDIRKVVASLNIEQGHFEEQAFRAAQKIAAKREEEAIPERELTFKEVVALETKGLSFRVKQVLQHQIGYLKAEFPEGELSGGDFVFSECSFPPYDFIRMESLAAEILRAAPATLVEHESEHDASPLPQGSSDDLTTLYHQLRKYGDYNGLKNSADSVACELAAEVANFATGFNHHKLAKIKHALPTTRKEKWEQSRYMRIFAENLKAKVPEINGEAYSYVRAAQIFCFLRKSQVVYKDGTFQKEV